MSSHPTSSHSAQPVPGSHRYLWAIQAGNFRGPEMGILKTIALHFRPDNVRAWVSEQGIADRSGLNYKTIGRNRRALIADGCLRVVATRHVRQDGTVFERPFTGDASKGNDLRRAGGTPVYELDLERIKARRRLEELAASSRRRRTRSRGGGNPLLTGDVGLPSVEDRGSPPADDIGPPSAGEAIGASRSTIEAEPIPMAEQAPPTVESPVLAMSEQADLRPVAPPKPATANFARPADSTPTRAASTALSPAPTPLVLTATSTSPHRRRSAKAKLPKTEVRILAEAFAAGHRKAGDSDYSAPHYKQDFEALKAIVQGRSNGRQGDDLLDWLRETTAEFARTRAMAGDSARYWPGGHGPRGLEEWLNDRTRRRKVVIGSWLQQPAKVGEYDWMDARNRRRAAENASDGETAV